MNLFFQEKKKNFRVYFVGIGGVSMSALALFLKNKGFKVSGYDRSLGKNVKTLIEKGITVNEDKDLENCDIAVVSSAITDGNEKLEKLKALKKSIITRAQLLNYISKNFKIKIGVAGTHGKTTCTAMLAHVLKCANKKFCAHIGGIDKTLGNMVMCGEDIFLSEVCEYKKNISLFEPDFAILLNVSDDHLESYSSFNGLKQEFSSYLLRAKKSFVVYEDRALGSENSRTFSLNNTNANFYASEIKTGKNGIECIVNGTIGVLFKLKLNSFFVHDITNALACVAVCKEFGIKNEVIKEGLENFNGIKRRNEILAKKENTVVYADYAHHPEQIERTVEMLKSKYKKYAVFFQSHTYSRTSTLFKKFITALSKIDNLFVFDTYGAREKYDYKGSGKRISESVKGCVYCGAVENATAIFSAVYSQYECIAVIGAGDLYDKIEEYLNE